MSAIAIRLYRLVLFTYPSQFRRGFGAEMVRLLIDRRRHKSCSEWRILRDETGGVLAPAGATSAPPPASAPPEEHQFSSELLMSDESGRVGSGSSPSGFNQAILPVHSPPHVSKVRTDSGVGRPPRFSAGKTGALTSEVHKHAGPLPLEPAKSSTEPSRAGVVR